MHARVRCLVPSTLVAHRPVECPCPSHLDARDADAEWRRQHGQRPRGRGHERRPDGHVLCRSGWRVSHAAPRWQPANEAVPVTRAGHAHGLPAPIFAHAHASMSYPLLRLSRGWPPPRFPFACHPYSCSSTFSHQGPRNTRQCPCPPRQADPAACTGKAIYSSALHAVEPECSLQQSVPVLDRP